MKINTKIISFINHKGGTGKTTVLFNVAYGLTIKHGKRILMIDSDPQGNLTAAAGVIIKDESTLHNVFRKEVAANEAIQKIANNLYLLPADLYLCESEMELMTSPTGILRLRQVLRDIVTKNEYDYIFIDCPPSAGILSYNALVASDSINIVMTPDYFSISGLALLRSTLDNVKELNEKIKTLGIVINMVDSRRNLHKSIIQQLKDEFGGLIYETVINNSVALAESVIAHAPIFTYKSGTAAADFTRLTREIKERIKENE